jgi:hypothetical protein
VHLLHRYSNTPGLLSDLEAVRWTVRRTDLENEPTLPSTERPWRLRDRLSESDLDAIVLRFKHGEPMSSLAASTASPTGASATSSRNAVTASARTYHRLAKVSRTIRQTADNFAATSPLALSVQVG